MNCPKCGSELKPGSKFCGKCGEIIRTQKDSTERIFCRKCGKEVNPGSHFCGNCGAQTASGLKDSPIESPINPTTQSTLSDGIKRLLIILTILGICIAGVGLGGIIFKSRVKSELNAGIDSLFSALPEAADITGYPMDSDTSEQLAELKNYVQDNVPEVGDIIAAFLKNDSNKIIDSTNKIVDSVNKFYEEMGMDEGIADHIDASNKAVVSTVVSQLRTLLKNNFGKYWFMANLILYSLWILIGGMVIAAASIIIRLVLGGKISDIVTLKMIPAVVIGIMFLIGVGFVVSNALSSVITIINILSWPEALLEVYTQLMGFVTLFGF